MIFAKRRVLLSGRRHQPNKAMLLLGERAACGMSARFLMSG